MEKIGFYIALIKYYFYIVFNRYFKVKFRDKKIYNGKPIYSGIDGQMCIYNKLIENKPCMIARFGAVELLLINHYLRKKSKIEMNYSNNIREQVKYCAGIFPNDNETMDKVAQIYIDSIKDLDILAAWNFTNIEEYLVKSYGEEIEYVDLNSISSWKSNDYPWSRYLRGKKVLVIHPFKDSIVKQYENRDKLFKNKDVLPEFKELIVLKAVQSIGGNDQFESWIAALDYMKEEIDQIDFDVALIGAGAYGFPLASYIKKLGKQAIHCGGTLQMMFGIGGNRWKKNGELEQFKNEYWVFPSENEKPKDYKKTEGGCYW